MGLFSFFRQELAIDLGTANTLIVYEDKVVVDEPSIVAMDRNTRELLAVGTKAMHMHEKTHANIMIWSRGEEGFLPTSKWSSVFLPESQK